MSDSKRLLETDYYTITKADSPGNGVWRIQVEFRDENQNVADFFQRIKDSYDDEMLRRDNPGLDALHRKYLTMLKLLKR
jgi:hypothetical protein